MRVIDFHSHILPGVDDGSESVEMSRGMLARMVDEGVDIAVATPHYYGRHSTVEEFLERREKAADRLRDSLLKDRMAMPDILLGCEVAFRFGLEDDPDLEKLCIDGTRTLLLELPFGDWTDSEASAVQSIVLDRGLNVVLAHFERFPSFRKGSPVAARIANLPLTLQVNAEDLRPLLSRGKVLDLFRRRNVPLLGSDAHNLTDRAPDLAEGRDLIRRKLGASVLEASDRKAAELLGLQSE